MGAIHPAWGRQGVRHSHMQPATANSKPKKLLASSFSKLASQKQMHCGVTGHAPPAFWGTPSHPARVPVPQALPGWRGVEGALNSACPEGFEPTFLPLCLSPAALCLQLHQRVSCTLLFGCEWSRGPFAEGRGGLSLRLVSSTASAVETGPSCPKLGTRQRFSWALCSRLGAFPLCRAG